MNNRVIWISGICFSLFFTAMFIFSFRTTILMEAGRFMAPQGDYNADAAIVEGNEFIDGNAMMSGMNLLLSGKVKRIIIVLHQLPPSQRPFTLKEDYPDRVKKEMIALGLKESNFRIVVTPFHHPITLTEAREVLEIIPKMGTDIKSAILLAQGFHTRRSYLIYQYLCVPHQIKIFPSACFNSYQLDNWWSQESGIRDFAMEYLKLVYYFAVGYIPLKFSY